MSKGKAAEGERPSPVTTSLFPSTGPLHSSLVQASRHLYILPRSLGQIAFSFFSSARCWLYLPASLPSLPACLGLRTHCPGFDPRVLGGFCGCLQCLYFFRNPGGLTRVSGPPRFTSTLSQGQAPARLSVFPVFEKLCSRPVSLQEPRLSLPLLSPCRPPSVIAYIILLFTFQAVTAFAVPPISAFR